MSFQKEDISNRYVEHYSTTIFTYNKDGKKIIIDNDDLEWELVDDYMPCLTLKEISDQLKESGYDDLIYVWYELGINGYIYQYGNYEPKEWVEHGRTKGFA